jgi:hypothetical protein
MKDKVAVKKIVIQVGEKELALTPEAAQELLDALKDLLEKPSVTYVPYPVSEPVRRPYKFWEPVWIYLPSGTTGSYTISASSDDPDAITVLS